MHADWKRDGDPLPDPAVSVQFPLVVDLDGTLVRTDTLIESALLYFAHAPHHLPQLLLWAVKGAAVLKSRLADRVLPDAAHLPYRTELLEYLRAEKRRGRTIALVTAADVRIANSVAAHLGVFDQVIGTTEGDNVKGQRKLERIQSDVGKAFVYAGDSPVDLHVWEGAYAAVLVNASERVRRSVISTLPVELDLPAERFRISTWARALRVHQWSKNALVLVPLLTAFAFLRIEALTLALTAFLAFSLIASATYLINDLLDLEKDRRHPRKRLRPIASGEISALSASAISALLLAVGLSAAWLVSAQFALAACTYLGVTLWYSFRLKAMLLVDVIVLACLFTLRIVGGAIAIDVRVSVWLFAFSVFLFTSLALVKRCTELAVARDGLLSGGTGRAYRVQDLDALVPFGVASGVAAVLVFGLFISSADIVSREYRSPGLLWLVCVMLLYWVARIWVRTVRGEVNEDPVHFALTDRSSRYVLLFCVAVVLMAKFVSVPYLPF